MWWYSFIQHTLSNLENYTRRLTIRTWPRMLRMKTLIILVVEVTALEMRTAGFSIRVWNLEGSINIIILEYILIPGFWSFAWYCLKQVIAAPFGIFLGWGYGRLPDLRDPPQVQHSWTSVIDISRQISFTTMNLFFRKTSLGGTLIRSTIKIFT